ncbi:uncharacterized protein FTJAE_7890 [Fusarium tjaetaba]|uniref:Uncharacterized protein n=1 Tax=Fusarium tjaetaba TaxID=1567544 RepID=A0A8H5VNI2_9HYPO|nr:uncharacterized protein FTJAE_7890 [Fusarium tjaetaba]KAF5631487.1 hypothetical protein FTJAE_7890 [Fusarium tjaetaba]
MSEPKKRKAVENVDNDPEPTTGTQSREVTLSAEIDQLRAETKYLKESLADLRNSIASKDKLVDALERMLDTANKEIEQLRERQAKEKTPEDSRSLNERLQNHIFDEAHARFYPNASTKPK